MENFALGTHPVALLRIPFVRTLQAEQQNCRITVEMGGNCCTDSWEKPDPDLSKGSYGAVLTHHTPLLFGCSRLAVGCCHPSLCPSPCLGTHSLSLVPFPGGSRDWTAPPHCLGYLPAASFWCLQMSLLPHLLLTRQGIYAALWTSLAAGAWSTSSAFPCSRRADFTSFWGFWVFLTPGRQPTVGSACCSLNQKEPVPCPHDQTPWGALCHLHHCTGNEGETRWAGSELCLSLVSAQGWQDSLWTDLCVPSWSPMILQASDGCSCLCTRASPWESWGHGPRPGYMQGESQRIRMPGSLLEPVCHGAVYDPAQEGSRPLVSNPSFTAGIESVPWHVWHQHWA